MEVVLSADSLHDRQKALSDADRRKVDAQAAEALDATDHPRVVFRSERLDINPGSVNDSVHGSLHGTLTVRGREVPLDVAVDAERSASAWHVRGKARLKQSELGIKPFSGFGGTVGVKDEIRQHLASQALDQRFRDWISKNVRERHHVEVLN